MVHSIAMWTRPAILAVVLIFAARPKIAKCDNPVIQIQNLDWILSRKRLTRGHNRQGIRLIVSPRGGSSEPLKGDLGNATADDEERYSRQYYTLGARAHASVRASTVFIDGPVKSGLLYECAKNLALSGVGEIVVIIDDKMTEYASKSATTKKKIMKLHNAYHCDNFDDLGNAYRRAARTEVGHDDENGEVEILTEFLRRLNPILRVETVKRSRLMSGKGADRESMNFGDNPVLLSIDRPEKTQLSLSTLCRSVGMPFVSVESCGVYGRIFCDFGPDFEVVDPDGEAPKDTVFDRVEPLGASRRGSLSRHRKDTGDFEGFRCTVHCVEEERHDVSKGDFIEFHTDVHTDSDDAKKRKQRIIGEVLHVHSPSCFTVTIESKGTSGESQETISQINSLASSFSRLKRPYTVPFMPLKKALRVAREMALSQKSSNDGPQLFAMSDLDKSFDQTRRNALMSSFFALSAFSKTFSRLPATADDIGSFVEMSKSSGFYDNSAEDSNYEESWNAFVQSFAKCARGKLAAVQALFGALGAQEVLKAASRLYHPIQQFLIYDCDELLEVAQCEGGEMVCGSNSEPVRPTHTHGQDLVLGKRLTSALASQRVFVVGSGAIGCEVLKNLAAMGAGTSKKGRRGKVIITDMDTIEKSNLSRQLLFRDGDVGNFKSTAAQTATLRFNPSMNVEGHTSKVGEKVGDTPFNDKFWSTGVDVVMNALDNVEGRLYMDSKCVENGRAMIDAGTLGSKGNVQVVVPYQSESYGSSVDPPEPAIPVCTLKNFPYEISHTIQWAREMFEGLFTRRPTQANDNASVLASLGPAKFAQSLLSRLGEDAAVEAAEELGEDLSLSYFDAGDSSRYNELLMEFSLLWAVSMFNRLFVSPVKALLRQHPENSLDEDGEPFWSGIRKKPSVLTYMEPSTESDELQMVINEHIIDFVRAASRLRIETYILQPNNSSSVPSVARVKDALKSSMKADNFVEHAPVQKDKKGLLHQIASQLEGTTRTPGNLLRVVEFEKDDDSNGHVAFVNAASNLRALSYGIKPVDMMETRKISGNIVPAMITTTAFVSALSCIELMKLVLRAPLHLHRNAFVNLALPFFAFTSPLPADEIPGFDGETYTLWDRTTIKEGKKSAEGGGITLEQVLLRLKRKSGGADVSSLSFGPYLIYANFLHAGDSEIMAKPIWDLVKDALVSGDDIDDGFNEESFKADETKGNVDSLALKERTESQLQLISDVDSKPYLEFSAIVEDDESGEEVEIPPVRIIKWTQHLAKKSRNKGGHTM